MLTAALLIAAGLLSAPALELELAGGLAHTLEENYGRTDYPALVPAAQARAGLRLTDHLSIGATFLAVLRGESPKSRGLAGGQAGFEAVAGFASVRLHTAGEARLWIEGGAGIGHLISLQSETNDEHLPFGGRGAPAFRAAAGARTREGRALFGVELAWVRWNGVEQPAGIGGSGSPVPAASGLSTSALLLLLSIGLVAFP